MSNYKYEGAGNYQIRNGKKVRVVCDLREFGYTQNFPIVGVIDGGSCAWSLDGKIHEDKRESRYDLIGKWEETKELWVNVYPSGYGSQCKTKDEADYIANHNRIARIKVTYKEGQFDD